jgi:IS5 family transposase
MKTDGRLSRSPLKGTFGDAVFAVLCACGHNIRKILAHLRALFAWIIVAILTAVNVPRRDLQMLGTCSRAGRPVAACRSDITRRGGYPLGACPEWHAHARTCDP